MKGEKKTSKRAEDRTKATYLLAYLVRYLTGNITSHPHIPRANTTGVTLLQ